MNKYFIKYQWFYFIIVLVYFFYEFYNLNVYNYLKKNTELYTFMVIDKHCGAYKTSSSLKIEYLNKIYNVSYSKVDCFEFNVGNKIKVYYNKKHDYFIHQGENLNYIHRLKILGVIIILLLLPWNFIKNIFNKIFQITKKISCH